MTLIGLDYLKHQEDKRSHMAQEREQALSRLSKEDIASRDRASRERVSYLDRDSRERVAEHEQLVKWEMGNLDRALKRDQLELDKAKRIDSLYSKVDTYGGATAAAMAGLDVTFADALIAGLKETGVIRGVGGKEGILEKGLNSLLGANLKGSNVDPDSLLDFKFI